MSPGSVKINGERIFLSSLEECHATKEYCDWLNDPEVNRYLETKKITIAQLKKYIKEKNRSPDCLFSGIFYKKNKKHIGNIKLEPIDFKNRKASIGILIGDKNYWGRGLATEAVKLICNYAFLKLHLKEINLGVRPKNKRAIKLYEKCGFEVDNIIMSTKK